MKIEPEIDRASLLIVVREEYGIEADELIYIPVGYDAVCYAVRVLGEPRYFLKMWPKSPIAQGDFTSLDQSLRLTLALYERDLFPRIPYPITSSNGLLRASYQGVPFAVFPFLTGVAAPPWNDLSLALRDEFAHTVAAIHLATSDLADLLPPPDNYDVPFESALREGLDAVNRIGPHDTRPGLQSLRQLILPRGKEILIQLDRLNDLRQSISSLNGPVVLVHGDHGGANLLINATGRMFVLDWDEPSVGPPEFDFHYAMGVGHGDLFHFHSALAGNFARFLRVYREAGGPGPWHRDNFAFSLLRRALGDMSARLTKVLEGTASPEEDANALQGMKDWGFRRWRGLDKTLDAIEEALEA